MDSPPRYDNLHRRERLEHVGKQLARGVGYPYSIRERVALPVTYVRPSIDIDIDR